MVLNSVTGKMNTHTHRHMNVERGGLEAVQRETHSACGAQRHVVHLLGERSHHTGGVERQTGLYSCCWGDHSSLREEQGQLFYCIAKKYYTSNNIGGL